MLTKQIIIIINIHNFIAKRKLIGPLYYSTIIGIIRIQSVYSKRSFWRSYINHEYQSSVRIGTPNPHNWYAFTAYFPLPNPLLHYCTHCSRAPSKLSPVRASCMRVHAICRVQRAINACSCVLAARSHLAIAGLIWRYFFNFAQPHPTYGADLLSVINSTCIVLYTVLYSVVHCFWCTVRACACV